MSRPGITYQDVANAAQELLAQGFNPTIEGIRKLTGTGSNGTIAPYLRRFKEGISETHKFAAKENLPEEFVALMKGLWEKVLSHSSDQVAVIEAKYQGDANELQIELDKFKNNNNRWQKLLSVWQQEKNQLTNDKLALEQVLKVSQETGALLLAKQDMFVQQLQDKQGRIDELHRLHNVSQQNLEHYRESAREQRLLEQQQYDQQKQQFQAEIKMMQEQLIKQREKVSDMQQQHQLMQQSYSVLEEKHVQNELQLKKLTVALEATEKVKNEQLYASQHWQHQYKESQKIIGDQVSQLIDVQAETKLLAQQFMDAKQTLQNMQDLNKQLSLEKWALAQEKAQLEGFVTE